jgi:hypothetical protein
VLAELEPTVGAVCKQPVSASVHAAAKIETLKFMEITPFKKHFCNQFAQNKFTGAASDR